VTRARRYGIAVVLLVASASLVISAQGWKSRMPAFDLLTYMYSARALLDSGTIPQHGDTGSYGSYKPPGTAWLMLPGTALFGDPRAVAYAGTAVLHLLTLSGMLLLGWRCFGAWPACLAVLLYGLSTHGLFLAGSLWPNGRPESFVWFVVFAMGWALRRDARYLAAAAAVWGLGMYVDMAIAPALLVLPAIWLAYRPPVRPAPLLAVGGLLLVVWSPYLRLESSRGFTDMKSMLFLHYMLPEHFRQSWCDPSLKLTTWRELEASAGRTQGLSGTVEPEVPAGPPDLRARFQMFTDKLRSNFSNAVFIPGVDVVLLLLVAGAIMMCSLPRAPAVPGPPDQSRSASHRRTVVSALLIGAGLALYPIVLGWLPQAFTLPGSAVLRKLPQTLVLVGLLLGAAPPMLAATQRRLHRLGVAVEPTMPMRLLMISLVVPWLILVIVAEPGKPERFWWVWPLQAILLAGAVAYFLPKFPFSRVVVWLAQAALVAVITLNPFLSGRLESWRRDGWAGRDPDEVRVVDVVAEQVRREGRASAAIGYQLYLYPFMAEYNITNPVYRTGAELEIMLRYRHGIDNTDRCAEGISPRDQYRIVQRHPKSHPDEPQHTFAVPLDERFRLLRRVGLYDVYKGD